MHIPSFVTNTRPVVGTSSLPTVNKRGGATPCEYGGVVFACNNVRVCEMECISHGACVALTVTQQYFHYDNTT